MDTFALKQIVLEEASKYAGKLVNGSSYLLTDDIRGIYAVVDIATYKAQRAVGLGLVVQLADAHVVIEHDPNSEPFVDALIEAGVPRNQIVLAYAGETLPLDAPVSVNPSG